MRKRLDLFYGEFLAGGSRDLTDLVSILVKAQRYDLLQGEVRAGLVKRALQLFTDLRPVPEKKLKKLKVYLILKLGSRSAEEKQ